MNITKAHISVGTLITVIPLIAGAALWYDNRQDAQHEEIQAEATASDEAIQTVMFAGDVELSLQQIELELKMFRMIAERRALTADEQDRKEYLEALREILIAEQRKKVA